MRILSVATNVAVPPLDGIWLKQFHLYRHIGQRHDVHIAILGGLRTPIECNATLHQLPSSQKWLGKDILFFPWWVPLRVRRSSIQEIVRPFQAMVETIRPDIVQIDSVAHAWLARSVSTIPLILSMNDAESLSYRTQADAATAIVDSARCAFQSRWFSAFERRVMEFYDCTVVVAERDAGYLRALNPIARVEMIPLGVDADFFAPPRDAKRRNHQILFLGALNFSPNVDAVLHFCRDVFPGVRNEIPTASLVIVGRDPVPQVLALVADPAITVTGYVEDTRPFLWESGVMVVPTRMGTGMKNKVLEGVASGLPVCVYGDQWRGALSQDMVAMVTSPEEMTSRVTSILRNPDQARKHAGIARERIQIDLSWKSASDRYDRLYHELLT